LLVPVYRYIIHMLGHVWIDCFCVTPNTSPLIRNCNAIGCLFDVLIAGEASLIRYVCEEAWYHALLWASMHDHLSALLCTQDLQAANWIELCGYHQSGLTGVELSCTDIHASNKHAACNDVAEIIFMQMRSECTKCAPHDSG